ncbi:MAG TPA: lytic transglycosylase F [Desulfobulbus sp.]|nr:lytic transglycosylase F [Desulfobulbus sp.]
MVGTTVHSCRDLKKDLTSRVFGLLALIGVVLLSASPIFAGSKGDEELWQAKWKGDLNQMVERRFVRFLVPYSKTFYFFDGAKPRGLSYEGITHFEKYLNKQLKTKHLKVHAVIIPTARDKLLPYLLDGRGDVAVGNLTITDERRKVVDFSNPFLSNVSEILVSSLKGPEVQTVEDLSGLEVMVRPSSSYYESLVRLNGKLKAAGKAPVKIIAADENLEDEDILEMVEAGLVGLTVVDSHKARFWAGIFPKIKLHENIKLRSGGRIGWAFRKDSPQLKKVINAFVKTSKKGTLLGNVLFKRYLQERSYITNSTTSKDMKRFQKMVGYFEKYGHKYNFDYLMLAAVGFQESKLIQSKRSHVGAIGVMQVLPSTAKDKNVNIPDIETVQSNIHAGTKYLRFLENRYFNNPKISRMNRQLFAVASYNAGPARVAKLRRQAEKMGLDPNVWFRNVEVVAAKRIGRETVDYVSNIFKYYVAYTLVADKMIKQNKARAR